MLPNEIKLAVLNGHGPGTPQARLSPGTGDFIINRRSPTIRHQHSPVTKASPHSSLPDPKLVNFEALKVHAYVMGCNRRPGLVLPFLANQTHTLHIGTDYDLTPDVLPIREDYTSGSPLLSNWRVFRGHQDMMKRFLATKDELALFMEDDCVPNCTNWVSVVNAAVDAFPEGGEILSLYGRNFQRSRFNCDFKIGNREVLSLNPDVPQSEADRGGRHHVHGSLCYLVNRFGARRISKLKWEGIPCDVVFWDRAAKFQFVHPSPVHHNRDQGSLLFPSSCPPKRQ